MPQARSKIRVAQFGLGLIGIESIKLAASKPWVDVVGAIDIDPAKAGRPLADILGARIGGAVYESFDDMVAAGVKPNVVLHTAGSKVDEAFDQIEPLLEAGVHVISSCEELLFPKLRSPVRSGEIDRLCKKHNASLVGTGVNPGFVMDLLPVCLTGVSRSVTKIEVTRIVNASTRRMALQKKIGSGMDPDDFRALFKAGKAGHAGFQESAALIGHCLGWKFDSIVETCEPVIAKKNIQTQFFSVDRGLCCGLHQVINAKVSGEVRLHMDLQMVLDAHDPHDRVIVHGEPPIDCRLAGGVAGDAATVAALVNAIPRLIKVGPGLHLMTDLSVPALA